MKHDLNPTLSTTHFSRRDFVHTVAASIPAIAAFSAATSHALGAQQSAESPTTPETKPAPSIKRTLRKAAMIGMVGEGDTLLDRFKILRDCGFEGAEFDSPTQTPMEEVLAAQEKSGLIVHGLVDSQHWGKPLNHPAEQIREEAINAMETCIRDAKTLGSTSILLVPGIVNNDLPYDECYRLSQEGIRRVLPLARECNVKIAVENVWNGFLLSPLEAARYVDEFNDPLVTWHFDIGNVINFVRPAQWARILGKRIVKLHIKDFSLKKRDNEGLWKGFSVELGEGDAGWADVMKTLDDIGYSTAPQGNWATAEVRGGDRKRLQQVSEQMDTLFAM